MEIKDIENLLKNTRYEQFIGCFKPIDNDRNLLPAFFEKLAYLNKQNIVNGHYTSMYADGNYFETTAELADWEINYHKQYLQIFMETDEVSKYLNNLKMWLSCITDEAEECYKAYFNTLGIKDDEANEQIRAYELLSVLRKNTYLKYQKKDDDEEIGRRVKVIVGKNRFI